jgi:hypothetical protein
MVSSSNPQTQGGNNVCFQQPLVRPKQMPNLPNQSILMVPIGNPYQMGGYKSMPPPYLGSSPYPPKQYIGGPNGPFGINTMSPLNHNSFVNTPLPFFATLEFPNLSKLINDPIMHHPTWPPVLVKIPTNIPKFEGKMGDDPTSHITTYHLWCVSKSMLDDSIKSRLFPCTLTRNASKWFIKLPKSSFRDFGILAMAFLTHFQLPIHYETGTDLLTSLHQNTTTHIFDHIHEWRRKQILVKVQIPDVLLADWFTKSLLP